MLVLDGSGGDRLPWIARILKENGLKKYRVGTPKKPIAGDKLFCKDPAGAECVALARALKLTEDPATLDEAHSAYILVVVGTTGSGAGASTTSKRRRVSLWDRALPIVLPRKGFELAVDYSRVLNPVLPEIITEGDVQDPKGDWTSGLRLAVGFGPADVFFWTPLQQGGIERQGLLEEGTDPNGFAGGGTFAFGFDAGLTGWGEGRSRRTPDHAFRGGFVYKLGEKDAMGSLSLSHFKVLRGGSPAFFMEKKGVFGGFVGKTTVAAGGPKGGFFYGLGYGYDFSDKDVKPQLFRAGGGMMISIADVVAPILEVGLDGILMSSEFEGVRTKSTILDFQAMVGLRAFPIKNLFVYAATPLFEFISFDFKVEGSGSIASEDKGSFSTLLAGMGLRF